MKNKITYITDDKNLTSTDFIALAQRTWPGDYDKDKTASALRRTNNVTAWDGSRLVGTVRVLSDGYFFGTIPEILVDPDYQNAGIGKRLMKLAWDTSSTSLFFGAQPGHEGFYKRLGYESGLASFYLRKKGD